ncbi:hypothetical protein MBLNU230_g8532t1 [Neophaeotheca triangularis]
MDEPSLQLHASINQSLRASLSTRRPVLHHLNADTSWLLQIPRPINAVKHGSRHFYNILIDPWLSGGQSDVAKWFSQQFHASESAVKSIKEVEELAWGIESLVEESQRFNRNPRNGTEEDDDNDNHTNSPIDLVVISHEFTDHCHKDTLLEVHPDVPVVATTQAAKLITRWSHFRTVLTTPVFSPATDQRDWRSTSHPPLPDWLGVARLVAQNDALDYHSAILVTFNTCTQPSDPETAEAEAEAEALLYTPHGIPHGALASLPLAQPPIHTLAFLHGLHDISIGSAQQLNLGAHNGLKAQRLLEARYWIGTHDEVKRGGGLVAWFLRRRVVGLGEAVAMERERGGRKDGDGDVGEESGEDGEERRVWRSFDGVNWVELRNGESRVLI